MAQYPDITSGQRITAQLLRSMLPEIVYKTTIDTRTSATLTLDTELFVAAEPNAIYLVEFVLEPAAVTAEGFKTDWMVPADATGFKGVLGPSSTASNSNADLITMRAGVHNFVTAVPYAGVRNNANAAFSVRESGVVTTAGTAGTIGIRWAQNTAGATGSKLLSGSYMKVFRLS